MNFTWVIGGEAGFGIMTTGLVFSKIAARLGFEIFDYVQYPSLIRGGHNAYEVHVGNKMVTCLKPVIDILVCLNEETFKKHCDRLTKDSYVIYDPEEFKVNGDYQKIAIPFKKILAELKAKPVMKNTIALGASLAIIKCPLNELTKIIEEQFSKKGKEVVDFNVDFATRGYEHVKKEYEPFLKNWLEKKNSEDKKMVMTGNEAFALGAVIGDCRFYCAYPMTPSSTVLTVMASWATKIGIVVRHAEDEISVANTALGASFAGVRSAVGTSGGGFALMTETISLSGITETPIVVFIAQRPGPATGMPTWTEQGDLLFAVHAGHGEFPKIVLAPGDVKEMVELTSKAFNLADIYQLPVIVLSDMYLSEGHQTVDKKAIDDFTKNYAVNRGKTVFEHKEQGKYLRYKLTDDGISPRLIPGYAGQFYQANSYEHIEDGHTTEEAKPRIEQVDKRTRKLKTYFDKDFAAPKIYGDLEKAKIVFVSWGATKGIILQALKHLEEKSLTGALIHFSHVYPLDPQKIKPFFNHKDKKYILVENNSWGQFGKLLLQETGIQIENKILRYDGRPLTAEEIINNQETINQ